METSSTIKDEEIKPVGFCVAVNGELVTLLFEDILYIESDNNYCRVYSVEQTQPFTTRITIKEMTDLLPKAGFVRIHERYIVAEKLIKRFNTARTRLRISDNKWLPVSRRNRKILTTLFPTAVSK